MITKWHNYKCSYSVILLFVAGVAFDLLIPLGVAAGVVYVLPVLLTYYVKGKKVTYLAATIGVLLTLFGFIASPDGGELWKVITNRILAVIAITSVAVAIIKVKIQQNLLIEKTEHALTAEKKANDANKAKTVFLTSINHELRTPLNAVLGFSQLLAQDPKLADDHKESVQYILNSGETLLDMIQQALYFSEVQDGSLVPKIQKVELMPVVENAVAGFNEIAAKKNIHIDLSSLQHFAIKTIQTDAGLLLKIMQALLKNAINYNYESGQVKISCQLCEHQQLRFYIQDSGFGIHEHNKSDLFKPFSRLGFQTTEHSGLGLGLVKAKLFVEALHGQIGYQANPQKGSTFWFEIPII